MNKLYRYIHGYRRILITGASADRFINQLSELRIPFWGIEWIDEFSLWISVFPKDEARVLLAANRTLCNVELLNQVGASEALRGVFSRYVFLVGVAACLCTVLFFQNFLLFYDVSGNVTVSDDAILRGLESIGIGVGTLGADLNPKWIKDHMLELFPQLQWVTVTQNGSCANVVVRERPQTPMLSDRRVLANVIASKAGMITEQYILEGQALKQPGDLVEAGEMLVSGVVDLETRFSIVRAKAEIYAKTWYNKDIAIPEKCLNKCTDGTSSWCLWLEIGKRRIKIFGNSGISHTDCDKMINRKILTLPSDVKLPVSLLIEHFDAYDAVSANNSAADAQQMAMTYAETVLHDNMIAGEILHSDSTVVRADGVFRVKASFACQEMIAKTVEGKWNKEDY